MRNAFYLFYTFLIVVLCMYACQDKEQEHSEETLTVDVDNTRTHLKDVKNEPVVDIKVTRKYNEDGNLVSFDSTYTSYSASYTGDTLMIDDLLDAFQAIYVEHFNKVFTSHVNSTFFNDSTMHERFFHDDFFKAHMEMHPHLFTDLAVEMDSIKNEFYRVHFKHLENKKAKNKTLSMAQ